MLNVFGRKPRGWVGCRHQIEGGSSGFVSQVSGLRRPGLGSFRFQEDSGCLTIPLVLSSGRVVFTCALLAVASFALTRLARGNRIIWADDDSPK